MLKTASRDRDPRRQRLARLGRAHGLAGDDQQALEARRRLEALDVRVRAQHEAAEQRRGDVVRMALEPDRLGQQVGAELEDRVRRDEAGHERRGARAEAAGERDVGADRELEVVDRRQRRESPHAQVAAVARDPQVVWTAKRPVSTTSTSMCRSSAAPITSNPGPRLAEERGTRDTVRSRSHSSTARSTAAMSGSQGTTAPAWVSAVCGSFSPWPVSTQTTRSAPSTPWVSSPATDAAAAGSQNTPSLAARNR